MLYFRRTRFLRRIVLPLTLLAFLSACHKWVQLEPPVAHAIAAEELGTVRVTLTDSSRIVLKEPYVSGDSLMAMEEHARGVRLDEVARIEGRRANVPATVGLVIGILVVPVLALAVGCAVSGGCININ